jgi:DNA polymerase III subunit epsilon
MTLRAIYYDTETTGIKAEKDRIVEIAAYDPERQCTFERLINPGCPIPREASAIHHISDEMVTTAPSFAEVSQDFIQFCEGDVVLIAHNNDNFDYHFLRCEFERNSLIMPSWKFLDTLKWARRYRSDLPRHTLQFLREIYGIAANNAHRALEDVKVMHQMFQLMIDDLSIEDVYAMLNRSRSLQHMPFGKHQGQPLSQIPASYVKWLASNEVFDKPENKELKEAFAKLGLLDNSSPVLAATVA